VKVTDELVPPDPEQADTTSATRTPKAKRLADPRGSLTRAIRCHLGSFIARVVPPS